MRSKIKGTISNTKHKKYSSKKNMKTNETKSNSKNEQCEPPKGNERFLERKPKKHTKQKRNKEQKWTMQFA